MELRFEVVDGISVIWSGDDTSEATEVIRAWAEEFLDADAEIRLCDLSRLRLLVDGVPVELDELATEVLSTWDYTPEEPEYRVIDGDGKVVCEIDCLMTARLIASLVDIRDGYSDTSAMILPC